MALISRIERVMRRARHHYGFSEIVPGPELTEFQNYGIRKLHGSIDSGNERVTFSWCRMISPLVNVLQARIRIHTMDAYCRIKLNKSASYMIRDYSGPETYRFNTINFQSRRKLVTSAKRHVEFASLSSLR